MSTFGERLKAYREASNKIQKDVSKHLGISLDTVWRWENNKGEPSLSQLQELAKYLNTTVSNLAGECDVLIPHTHEDTKCNRVTVMTSAHRAPSKILKDIADLNDELAETAGTFTESEARSAETLLHLCLENFEASGAASQKQETA